MDNTSKHRRLFQKWSHKTFHSEKRNFLFSSFVLSNCIYILSKEPQKKHCFKNPTIWKPTVAVSQNTLNVYIYPLNSRSNVHLLVHPKKPSYLLQNKLQHVCHWISPTGPNWFSSYNFRPHPSIYLFLFPC